MKVEFRRAVKFTGSTGKHVFYKIGVHDVPEHVVSDPFFKILVEHGLAIEPKEEVSEAKSIEQRKIALEEKLEEKLVEEKPAEKAPKKESKKKK